MVLEASGTTLENLQKIIRKHRSERLFGPIFSNFPMLAHVVSLRGGLEGPSFVENTNLELSSM